MDYLSTAYTECKQVPKWTHGVTILISSREIPPRIPPRRCVGACLDGDSPPSHFSVETHVGIHVKYPLCYCPILTKIGISSESVRLCTDSRGMLITMDVWYIS